MDEFSDGHAINSDQPITTPAETLSWCESVMYGIVGAAICALAVWLAIVSWPIFVAVTA